MVSRALLKHRLGPLVLLWCCQRSIGLQLSHSHACAWPWSLVDPDVSSPPGLIAAQLHHCDPADSYWISSKLVKNMAKKNKHPNHKAVKLSHTDHSLYLHLSSYSLCQGTAFKVLSVPSYFAHPQIFYFAVVCMHIFSYFELVIRKLDYKPFLFS